MCFRIFVLFKLTVTIHSLLHDAYYKNTEIQKNCQLRKAANMHNEYTQD